MIPTKCYKDLMTEQGDQSTLIESHKGESVNTKGLKEVTSCANKYHKLPLSQDREKS